jgi:hypothetical protein
MPPALHLAHSPVTPTFFWFAASFGGTQPRELRRKAQAAKKKSKTGKGPQIVQQDDDESNSDADSDGGAAAEDTVDAADAPEDGEEGEEEQNIIGAVSRTKISPKWTNRQRTLVFSSRGISYVLVLMFLPRCPH